MKISRSIKICNFCFYSFQYSFFKSLLRLGQRHIYKYFIYIYMNFKKCNIILFSLGIFQYVFLFTYLFLFCNENHWITHPIERSAIWLVNCKWQALERYSIDRTCEESSWIDLKKKNPSYFQAIPGHYKVLRYLKIRFKREKCKIPH